MVGKLADPCSIEQAIKVLNRFDLEISGIHGTAVKNKHYGKETLMHCKHCLV